MKKKTILFAVLSLSLACNAYSGDEYCKGFTSKSNPFLCYTYGNCPWWVAYKRPDLKAFMRHHAAQWYADAVERKFPVGNVPRVGAAVIFFPILNEKGESSGNYGHVAYVDNVFSDGSFHVSEMDYYGSFGDGMQQATYLPATTCDPQAAGCYKRKGDGAKQAGSYSYTLIGFIYERQCLFLSDTTGVLCWNGDDGYHAFREDGDNYVLYKKKAKDYSTQYLSTEEGRDYSDKIDFGFYPHHSDVDLGVYLSTGTVTSNGVGGTSSTPINQAPANNLPPPEAGRLPDFVVNRISIGNQSGSNERYRY